MTTGFIYCPRCGAPLAEAVRFGRPRPTCRYCGFIHFADPKVAVAGLVADAGRVLLVRRAIIPRIGYWALPAGYMDADEAPEEALAREIREETGLEVRVTEFRGLAPLAGWKERRGILLLYTAVRVSGDAAAGDDVSEVGWFSPEQIPWAELAFESTAQFLHQWVELQLKTSNE